MPNHIHLLMYIDKCRDPILAGHENKITDHENLMDNNIRTTQDVVPTNIILTDKKPK